MEVISHNLEGSGRNVQSGHREPIGNIVGTCWNRTGVARMCFRSTLNNMLPQLHEGTSGALLGRTGENQSRDL